MKFIMIVFSLLLWVVIFSVWHKCAAGPFLDLDLGTHLTDWPEQNYNGQPALGPESPIGIIRIGYQTKKWNFAGPLNVRAHGYYEHMSSAGTPKDSGVDVLMFGIRIE